MLDLGSWRKCRALLRTPIHPRESSCRFVFARCDRTIHARVLRLMVTPGRVSVAEFSKRGAHIDLNAVAISGTVPTAPPGATLPSAPRPFGPGRTLASPSFRATLNYLHKWSTTCIMNFPMTSLLIDWGALQMSASAPSSSG